MSPRSIGVYLETPEASFPDSASKLEQNSRGKIAELVNARRSDYFRGIYAGVSPEMCPASILGVLLWLHFAEGFFH